MTFTVGGKVTIERKHGKKVRKSSTAVVRTRGHAESDSWRKVTVKLSRLALAALKKHVPESAKFTLTAKGRYASTAVTRLVKHLR